MMSKVTGSMLIFGVLGNLDTFHGDDLNALRG